MMYNLLTSLFNIKSPKINQNSAYMNGDNAELCPNTIKIPAKASAIIIGKSHHFFLTLKNSQSSFNSGLLFDILINLTIVNL